MTERRDLAANERAVLVRVLQDARFDGAGGLRAQIEHAKVVGGPPTFLRLNVEVGALPSAFRNGRVPIRAIVESGEILLWVENGYLSAVEFAWVTDEEPDALPPAQQLQTAHE